MEEAKAAIKQFVSKNGKNDTTVQEEQRPAVMHEHITPTRHEEMATAIDREVHQHHYHTSVQPIQDREVRPEQHTHNLMPVEHREFEHGDSKADKELLAREAAQFKDVTETGKTQYTRSERGAVAGEHVHHHVHEYIQPVVQKETIQPSVIHTTVPIHEVHNNAAQHHAASALPAVSMAEWKKAGGTLTGREIRTDRFEGEPQAETADQHARHSGIHQHGINTKSSASSSPIDATSKNSMSDSAARKNAPAMNIVSTTSPTASSVDPRVDAAAKKVASASTTGTRSSTGASEATSRTSMSTTGESKYADTHLGSKMDESAMAKNAAKLANSKTGIVGAMGAGTGTVTQVAAEEPKRKSSLLKRLNPLSDADGDGRKGIMT